MLLLPRRNNMNLIKKIAIYETPLPLWIFLTAIFLTWNPILSPGTACLRLTCWCISIDLTSALRLVGAKFRFIPGLMIPVSTCLIYQKEGKEIWVCKSIYYYFALEDCIVVYSPRPTGTVPIPPVLYYTSLTGTRSGLSVGLLGAWILSEAWSNVTPLYCTRVIVLIFQSYCHPSNLR